MNRGVFLVKAGIVAFLAIMLAGPGAAIFPGTLRWAAWVACPRGTQPAPRTFRASYHTPGERGVAFYCVAPDGTEHERTLAAMGGLWLMYVMGLSVLFSFVGATVRPAGARANPSTSPRPVPASVEARARELMARDQKIQAIKVIRDASGMGLAEAKAWVEALPNRAPGAAAAASSTDTTATAPKPSPAVPRTAPAILAPEQDAAVRSLIASGNTISAIKVVRDATGMGLKEAKDLVEALIDQMFAPSAAAPVPAHPPGAADRLAELKRMLDAGLITEAEYDAKKREILAEL